VHKKTGKEIWMAAKAKPMRRPTTKPRSVGAPNVKPPSAVPTVQPVPSIDPIPSETQLKGYPVMNTHSFDNVGNAAREQLEKASQTAYKSYEEMTKLQKDNWDAFVASSQIWAKGAEVVGKAWMSLAQDTLENAASTAKALVGVKSLREAVDLQTDFAKGNFDKFVAEGTKLSETVVKVANDAMEPITARVNVTVEKIFKPLAA
jgi:phasin family protein